MTDLVEIGFKAETTGITKASKELDKMAKSGDKADKSLDKLEKTEKDVAKSTRQLSKATDDATKSIAKKSRGLGQASVQVQQFVDQVRGGQSPMLAFSQQAADIGIVLGAPLLGAIAGISAAIAGPFIMSLIGAGDAVKDFKADIGNLKDNLEELSEFGQNRLVAIQADSIKEAKGLREQYQELTKEIKELEKSRINPLAGSGNISPLDIAKREKEALKEINAELIIKRGTLEQVSEELDKQNKLYAEAGKQLKSIAETGKTTSGDSDKTTENYNNVTDALEAQIIALEQGEEAALRYNIAQRLQLKDGEKIPKAIQEQIEHFMFLKEAQEESAEAEKIAAKQRAQIERDEERKAKQQQKEFDKLINDVDNFGGAWTRTGNVIADSLGGAADALSDFGQRMSELNDLQVKIDNAQPKTTGERFELLKAQAKLEEEMVQARLSGLSSIAGTTAKLFDEESKGRKALHSAEKAFAAVEIALALKKASANALTAISSAFAAPFPVNFAAGAAMIGIMQGLGLFGGDGGGSAPSAEESQKTQGTGTLLGSDEKTESIANGIDMIANATEGSFLELQSLNRTMQDLSSGIEQLTISFVRGETGAQADLSGSSFLDTGLGGVLRKIDPVARLFDVIGLGGIADDIFKFAGNVKKSLVNSGIEFLTQTFDEISGELDARFFSDVRRKEKAFGITISDKTKRSFDTLDATLAGQIEGVFGLIGSSIVESGQLLGIDVGDRLSKQIIGGFELSLKDLSGEEIQQELNAVFGAQADLLAARLIPITQQYQKVGEGSFETLQRLAVEQVSFNKTLDALNISLSHLSATSQIVIGQDIVGLIGGLDNFAGAANAFVSNFVSDADKFNILAGDLEEAFIGLGVEFVQSRDGFKDIVTGLDLTRESGRELFATLLQLSPQMDEYLSQIEAIEKQRQALSLELLRVQGEAEQVLAIERQNQLDTLDESLHALQKQIFAEQDRIAALEAEEQALQDAIAAQDEYIASIENGIRNTFGKLNDAIDLQRQNAQASLDAAKNARDIELRRIGGLRDNLNKELSLRETALKDSENVLKSSLSTELNLIQENADKRISSLNAERSAIESNIQALRGLTGGIDSALGTGSTLQGALAAARGGNFGAAQGLDFAGLANLDPASFASATEFKIQQAVNRNRLATIRALAESEASRQETSVQAINRQTNNIKEQAAIDQALLQKQVDELLGVNTGVLSLDEAINQFKESQQALDALNYDKELSKLDMMVESANDVYNLHEQSYQEQITLLDTIAANTESSFNAALGIDDSLVTVADGIVALNDQITNLIEARSASQIIGESTAAPITANAPTRSNPVIREDAEKQKAMMLEVVKNTKQTANILQKLQIDGVDTRVIDS